MLMHIGPLMSFAGVVSETKSTPCIGFIDVCSRLISCMCARLCNSFRYVLFLHKAMLLDAFSCHAFDYTLFKEHRFVKATQGLRTVPSGDNSEMMIWTSSMLGGVIIVVVLLSLLHVMILILVVICS